MLYLLHCLCNEILITLKLILQNNQTSFLFLLLYISQVHIILSHMLNIFFFKLLCYVIYLNGLGGKTCKVYIICRFVPVLWVSRILYKYIWCFRLTWHWIMMLTNPCTISVSGSTFWTFPPLRVMEECTMTMLFYWQGKYQLSHKYTQMFKFCFL